MLDIGDSSSGRLRQHLPLGGSIVTSAAILDGLIAFELVGRVVAVRPEQGQRVRQMH